MARHARGAIEHARGGGRVSCAEHRTATGALLAPSALRAEREDRAVAGGDPLDTRPDLLDRSSALVSGDHGERIDRLAVEDERVAVADAARADPHEDLAPGGWREVDALDREWCVDRIQERGAHLQSLLFASSGSSTRMRASESRSRSAVISSSPSPASAITRPQGSAMSA